MELCHEGIKTDQQGQIYGDIDGYQTCRLYIISNNGDAMSADTRFIHLFDIFLNPTFIVL